MATVMQERAEAAARVARRPAPAGWTPRIVSVSITRLGDFAPGHKPPPHWDADDLCVDAVWADVERPDTGGICVGRNPQLAGRLAAAMLAGVAFTDARYAVTTCGVSYVAADSTISGRHLNADLKRLGY